ncbi:MAG: preprotein translocase subunit YajC [Treponemataceae bacterium]|nr:preprotein translocase subunit YajC [Treponemataceae bacterium]
MQFLAMLQEAPASTGSPIMTIVMFGLIFVIFYFFIIRPQNKKQKETEKMIAALKKGDKIVTIGGIHGTVVTTKEATVVVKVDDGTKIEFSRSAVASVVVDKKEEEKAAKKNAKEKAKQVEDKTESKDTPVEDDKKSEKTSSEE